MAHQVTWMQLNFALHTWERWCDLTVRSVRIQASRGEFEESPGRFIGSTNFIAEGVTMAQAQRSIWRLPEDWARRSAETGVDRSPGDGIGTRRLHHLRHIRACYNADYDSARGRGPGRPCLSAVPLIVARGPDSDGGPHLVGA